MRNKRVDKKDIKTLLSFNRAVQADVKETEAASSHAIEDEGMHSSI
jgi:hypothetical protein